jgi:hypothetical protein
MRNAYKILIGKPGGVDGRIILIWIFWKCEHSNEQFGSIKDGESDW